MPAKITADQLPTVTTGEIISVGAFTGKTTKLLSITIEGDTWSLAMGGNKRVYALCGMCDNSSGFRPGYAHVMGGVCFHCGGGGIHHLFADTLEQAQKKVRAASRRRETEARKAAEKVAAYAAKKDAWMTDNAPFVSTLTEFLASRDMVMPEITVEDDAPNWKHNDALYAAEDALRDRMAKSVDEYAFTTLSDFVGKILTEKQLELAATLMARVVEKEAAKAEKISASRYAIGNKGDKISVTGKVVARFSADTEDPYGRAIYRKGFIIEGTGKDAGVTVKWIASGASQYTADKGDDVVITGKIKDLTEYNGVKQTVLFYCKISK